MVIIGMALRLRARPADEPGEKNRRMCLTAPIRPSSRCRASDRHRRRVLAYTLGVDLGTTFSAAATIDEDGLPTMVGLGNRALQIPSVVFVRDDGSMLVGEQAEREATTDPTRVVREFKRRVGDDIPIVVAGKPYSPELMMARVLRWVVDQTSERRGEAPTQVSLTHPVAWTRDYKVGKLHEAARLAGLEKIATCPEPVAAAMN